MFIGSLCTGFGGVELGIASVVPGAHAIWHAEVDPDASAVLAHHWPDVPNLGDARNAVNAAPVDLLCAGFPCQPVSAAGRQLGTADPRWLWPVVRDVIEHQRPPAVFLENVQNIVSILKGEIHALILKDLRDLGYACRWLKLGACAVGAAHHRHRWFLYGRHVGDGAPPAEQVPVETCGARRGQAGRIFPTPRARDGSTQGGGVGSADFWSRNDHRRMQLPAAVAVLLPTPQARDGDNRGAPTPELAAQRIGERKNLDDAVISTLASPAMVMLPTPITSDGNGPGIRKASYGQDLRTVTTMLPTPSAADGNGGHVNRSGDRSGEVLLGGIGKLLPTPRASDGQNGRGNPNQHGGRGASDPSMGMAVQAEHFGRYADAVGRQIDALGMYPPNPTEPNTKGNPRLNPAFAEWLMGLPSGHVTEHAARNASLRMIGNGAMPQQVAMAWLILTQPPQSHEEGTPPVSETTEDLQGTADHPAGEPAEDPNEQPFGTEITLGGATRDMLRTASSVFRDVAAAVEFHGNGQLLRDVLGVIERAAAEASRHQPKWRKANGCPELAELNPAALRQLAALCRVWQAAGDGRVEPALPLRAEPDDVTAPLREFVASLPDASLTLTGEVDIAPVDTATELARIEEEVRQERERAGGTVETVDVTSAFSAHRVEVPNPRTADPFADPAPVSDIVVELVGQLLPEAEPDPFSAPAPVPAGFAPDGSDDGIPF
jgi:DNA (cytosine-5)-methyltransferase 1